MIVPSAEPGLPGTSRQEGETFTARARAKLNLYLHIVGRRADGFHLLESLVGFAEIGDTVSVVLDDGLSLAVAGPFADALAATPASDNLVLRAAESLAEWAQHYDGRHLGARVRLTKALPVASGIGGGSADAAATLLALRAAWRLAIDDRALAALGGRLGSDVPACLAGAPALMSGAGEVLTPVPALPSAPLVLVNPGMPLSTPAVYKAFAAAYPTLRPPDAPGPVGPWSTVEDMAAALAPTTNDLESAALGLCPAIAEALAALRAAPGCLLARMSGSGATGFGLFKTPEQATRAADTLRAARPPWWTAACRLETDAGAPPR